MGHTHTHTQTSLTEEVQDENLNWSEPSSRGWEIPSKTEDDDLHPVQHAAWETNAVQKGTGKLANLTGYKPISPTNRPLTPTNAQSQLFAAANHTTSPTNQTNLLTFPTQTQIGKIGREKTEKPQRNSYMFPTHMHFIQYTEVHGIQVAWAIFGNSGSLGYLLW